VIKENFYARLFNANYVSFIGAIDNYNATNKPLLGIVGQNDLQSGNIVRFNKHDLKKVPVVQVSVIKTRQNGSKFMKVIELRCSAYKLEALLGNPRALSLPNCRIVSARLKQ
jgi:hypothetical protein